MRALSHVVLAFCAVAASGCVGQPPVERIVASPITQLDGEQVNALLPYMVGRKGGVVEHHATNVPGKNLIMHETTQAFTFDVWIDADGHPVPPSSGGGTPSALKHPTLHHGSFVVICASACEWATSAESCELRGCQPITDEACGCTPPDCPGCIPLYCGSVVQGALAGALIM